MVVLEIGLQEIEDLVIGATILGAGGGGDPYISKLLAKKAIEKYGKVKLIQPYQVPDDALVIPTNVMGATTILQEKILSGEEAYEALRYLESYLGEKTFATMPTEVGGLNSVTPFIVASKAGIPVVDCDGMGRALPEHQMTSFHVYGINAAPMVINNEKNEHILIQIKDNYRATDISRSLLAQMGGIGNMAGYTMTGEQMKETAISGTISFAIRLGSSIRKAIENKANVFAKIQEATNSSIYSKAIQLFLGKIIDVDRRLNESYLRGRVVIKGYKEFEGQECTIHFQNENLVAYRNNEKIAMVPDIISYLDAETGRPLTIEQIKYGYRIMVIGIPTPEIMRTNEAIKVWGPRYFGYDFDYEPIEHLHKQILIKLANQKLIEKEVKRNVHSVSG